MPSVTAKIAPSFYCLLKATTATKVGNGDAFLSHLRSHPSPPLRASHRADLSPEADGLSIQN